VSGSSARRPPRRSASGPIGVPRWWSIDGRAPATLTSLLPFQLEARTVRLTATKLKTKTLPGKTLGKTLDGDAAVGSIVVEVFESERFFPFLGWQEPKGQLDEFFTARFSRTVSGKR
jgi:hypothetical protein